MSTLASRFFSRNPGLAAQLSRLSDGGAAARPGGGQIRAMVAALSRTSASYSGLTVVDKKELEGLRKDRERLDWIESREHTEFEKGTSVWCITKGERNGDNQPFGHYPYRFQGDLRAAIDSASQTTKEGQ